MAHVRCGRSLLRQLIKETNKPISGHTIHPLLFVGQGLRFRKLEVILTTTIEKLGKAGETVKVAPGYFRNHLMPKLLAVPNIEKYAYLIREQRKIYQHEEAETETVETSEDKMKEYQVAAKRLDNALLVARQLCVSIQPENMHLPTPLTSLGEYEVPLRLPRSIPLPEGKLHWSLKVKIRRK
ncbi:uncharacterized protein LOC131256951 isoform X2 [Magnolia sinica]|uniref:uncharacterized protein LOC131256951 isoform X2 n=1 Tax=Magnolia sinica TaxID=86752 RepID=UPI00265996A3|nr:uncharacterized protein LOC131256951 isoform X2 [Magnolia sinica]